MTDMLEFELPLVKGGTGGPPDDNFWAVCIVIVCILIFIGIIVWCIKH